jgi:hypothetical protein
MNTVSLTHMMSMLTSPNSSKNGMPPLHNISLASTIPSVDIFNYKPTFDTFLRNITPPTTPLLEKIRYTLPPYTTSSTGRDMQRPSHTFGIQASHQILPKRISAWILWSLL